MNAFEKRSLSSHALASESNLKGYRMIQEFKIRNFRCFKEINLRDLRSVNILVGNNGSGKTALLEAFLLAAYADPRVVPLIKITRGQPIPQGHIAWNKSLFRFLCEDFFFNFAENGINAEFTDSEKGKISVSVYFERPEHEMAFSWVASIPDLVFSRRESPEYGSRAELRIDDQGNAVYRGSNEPLPQVYILSSTTQFHSADIVKLFSDLSRQGRESTVIEAMKADFPEIDDITVLLDGEVPGLFVATKNMPNAKIPLALVSAGAARYLNLFLAIAMTQKGIVLVDEIENGLHWRKMPNIWKRLRQLCVDTGVQLFATTHSNECLQSLLEAADGHEDDFSLIRTEVSKTGDHNLKQFAGKSLFAALRARGEIR